MDEMIEFCIPHTVMANSALTVDEARNMMKEFFSDTQALENKIN